MESARAPGFMGRGPGVVSEKPTQDSIETVQYFRSANGHADITAYIALSPRAWVI